METKLLEGIFKNTSSKETFNLVVSDNKCVIKTRFNPSLNLKKDSVYEMGLMNLETYWSFPNITEKNNILTIKYEDTESYTIVINKGVYELAEINTFIKQELIKLELDENIISFEPNRNTLKCIMTLKPNWSVNFQIENSINTILGFYSNIYGGGNETSVYESENIVNIISINSILVHSNIISHSYVNGVTQPVIYSFFPSVAPGEKIIIQPKNVVYLPLTLSTISSMSTWLTDQDNNKIDLRGENLTIRLHIREK